MPRRLIASICLFIIFTMTTPYAYADVSKWANGSWGWVPSGENKDELEKLACGTNPLTIKLDLEKRRYTAFREGDDPILGKILSYGARVVVIQYDNEKRLMDNGKPHVWAMFFSSRDEFTWVRQGWVKKDGAFKSTSQLERCVLSIS